MALRKRSQGRTGQRGRGRLVFTAPNGGPLRNSTWHSRFWTPAVWAAGLPGRLRIHDLRHTCAALLISRGAHVKAVQHHLGHSSATVTLNTYSHLFHDAMERVVDGLDETYREAETACRRPELDARVLDLRVPGRLMCSELHFRLAEGEGLEPTSPFGQRFSRPSACQLA